MKLEILAAIQILEKLVKELPTMEERLQAEIALTEIVKRVNKLEEK